MRAILDKTLPDIDLVLASVVVFLSGIGIIMVYSASGIISWSYFGDHTAYLYRQVFYTILGIIVMILSSLVDVKYYRRIVYPLLFISFVLMLLVFTPLGYRGGGAARWIKLGWFTFEVTELVKLSIILWISHSIAKKREKVKTFTIGFLPHSIVVGILILLSLLQPDFGTASILAVITFVLLFIGGAKISYLMLGGFIAFAIGYHAIVSSPYRLQRIQAFLDPFSHRFDIGYQITQSLIAFGVGGDKGLGLGEGKQKLLFLPSPHNDFISAIIGEEFGFIGLMILLALFLILIWRGITIAWKAQEPFSSLVAIGITTLIALQVIINIGVALAIIPSKGLNLPFVSYGGSATLIFMWSIGIMLSISSSVNKREGQNGK